MERDLRAGLPAGTRPDLSLSPLTGPGEEPAKEPAKDPEKEPAKAPGKRWQLPRSRNGAGRSFAAGPPPLGLYVHLPWCLRKCPYCDFNSHAAVNQIPERRYLEALVADLDAQRGLSDDDRPLRSVFIGGGTPSLFSGTAIGLLLDAVRRRCRLADDAEITLEANPGAIDAGHFGDYLRAGVNRLSIGVQSLSATHLTALGRIHDPRQALVAYDVARRAGFGNINLDMMFGLPRQSMAQARDDLARLIDLQPEHVSYYQLTLEPNTAFAHRPPPVPDDDQLCDMQEQGIAQLSTAGYQRYEVSAYARPDRRCRHNLNYWRFGDYIGIGAGAHGKITDATSGTVERRACRRDPDAYMDVGKNADGRSRRLAGTVKADDAGSAPAFKAGWRKHSEPCDQQPDTEAGRQDKPRQHKSDDKKGDGNRLSTRRALSDDDLVLEFALNALRLVDGVDAALFEHHTGLVLRRIEPILAQARDDGLLTTEPGIMRPTEMGLRFLNELVGRFDQ